MPRVKRLYLTLGLVVLFAVAGAAMAAASQGVLDPGTPQVQAQACDDQDEADGTTVPAIIEAVQDFIERECDDQTEAESGSQEGQPGTLDDGKNLLPQAGITLEEAIATAQGAAPGPVREVELEYVASMLVFKVEVGDKDVQVDASNGTVISVTPDD